MWPQALPDKLADCLPVHHSLADCTHLFKYIPEQRGEGSCRLILKVTDHLVLCLMNLFHTLAFS